MEMTKCFADILSDLSSEEMDEFVSPVPDEIKLSAEEVRQALEHMPKKRSREKAKEERTRLLGQALIAKREMALVNNFVRKALGPDPTNEQREAMQAALGHMYRLGGMFMKTHQAKPMYAAAAVADVRQKRWDNDRQKQRYEVIDAALLAEPNEPAKRLRQKINTKLEECGLDKVSLSHLYARKKILGQPDEES
jgi:hypothetical protein